MNCNLKKVISFNQHHPQLMFYLSLSLLLISLLGSSYFINTRGQLSQSYASYQKHYRSCTYLEKAKKCLDQAKKEPLAFIQENLEHLSFLKHLEHRHNQTPHPSLPIHLNPYENTLHHTSSVLSAKKFKKTFFALIKPILADEEDLKQLFSLIEHENIFPYQKLMNAPYFFFTYFKIKKHSLGLSENVYEISYNLESISL